MDQLRAAFDEAKTVKGHADCNHYEDCKRQRVFPSWKTRLAGMEKLRMMKQYAQAMEDLEKGR